MMRRQPLVILCLAALAACEDREAPRRVGIVSSTHRLVDASRGFKEELLELASRRRWDVTFIEAEFRDDADGLREAVRALIDTDRVELVVAVSTLAAQAAAEVATPRGVPVVFLMVSDPLEAALVPELIRPGGLVTGVMDSGASLAGKRLEHLLVAHTGIERVLVPHTSSQPSLAIMGSLRPAAKKLGVELVELEIDSQRELEEAYAAIEPGEVDAIYVVSDVTVGSAEAALAQAVARLGIPSIAGGRAQTGAVFGFGTAPSEAGRRGALLVGKVMDGIPVGDLPVLNAPLPVMRIYANNASELGYEIQESAYWLTDEVIE